MAQETPKKVGIYDHATARRGGLPSWAWIVLAVVVLVLLFWLLGIFGGADQPATPPA